MVILYYIYGFERGTTMTDKYNYTVPIKEITPYALQTNAEGSVLLENDGTLPFRSGDKIAVFGRMQSHYNHSGTGSGGLVNKPYTLTIFDCLNNNSDIELNRELREEYVEWLKDNPYDNGPAWPGPPWSQVEMPLSRETVERAAKKSNKALFIIARNAGESRDNYVGEGSYFLSQTERENLKLVTECFDKVCVVLNVGNIIDMNWVREYNVNAVLYVWQGGQDGAQAVADIVCGKLVPSGKLVNAIPYDINKHPATEGFTEPMEIVYKDDIFVGYRFFETFDKDNVMYPFGYGRGYTDFAVSRVKCFADDENITTSFCVRNIGGYAGKETVQIYYGKNGTNRPAKSLIAFKKTEPLLSGETQDLKVSFKICDMAYFDEERSAFILDEGTYQIYVGTDSRNAALVFEYKNEAEKVICECKDTLNPDREFMRMKNVGGTLAWEKVTPKENYVSAKPEEIPYTGDKGIKLADVYEGKNTLDEFVAQLSDFDMACLTQGEGMSSLKVRPGTAGAFGGLTQSLRNFGISAAAVCDGPSGVRLEGGIQATSFPGGTMLACTFNPKLVESLYKFLGIELLKLRVDGLLGPGINVHRSPLCGRNFEYLSEDPYLTGVIGCAMCRGIGIEGVSATIKHFAANNREQNRSVANSIVSKRALREIYLKPFEMIVKDGHTRMIMTAYNRINGDFCSANYHLATTVLREDWGFDGLVMTDWWPNTALPTVAEKSDSRIGFVVSQNDLFMVNRDARDPAKKIVEGIKNGTVLRGELQRNAKNILRVILKSLNFRYFLEGDVLGSQTDLDADNALFETGPLKDGEVATFHVGVAVNCGVRLTYTSPADSLTQMPVDFFINGARRGTFALNGTNGEESSDIILCWTAGDTNNIHLKFDPSLVEVKKLEIIV